MTDAETLRALADEVEGLGGADEEMDARVTAAIGALLDPYPAAVQGVVRYEAKLHRKKWIVARALNGTPITDFRVRQCTSSIDAAAALMPAGWLPEIVKVHHRWRAMGIPSPGGIAVVGFGATEPLARTACALRAIAADIEAKEPDHA